MDGCEREGREGSARKWPRVCVCVRASRTRHLHGVESPDDCASRPCYTYSRAACTWGERAQAGLAKRTDSRRGGSEVGIGGGLVFFFGGLGRGELLKARR